MKKYIVMLVCGLLLTGFGLMLYTDAQSWLWWHKYVYWGFHPQDAEWLHDAQLQSVVGCVMTVFGIALAFIGTLRWVKARENRNGDK